MKVRTNLSIDEKLIEKAKIKASNMGFNFSAYITYLINQDMASTSNVVIPAAKNNKVSNAISNILD